MWSQAAPGPLHRAGEQLGSLPKGSEDGGPRSGRPRGRGMSCMWLLCRGPWSPGAIVFSEWWGTDGEQDGSRLTARLVTWDRMPGPEGILSVASPLVPALGAAKQQRAGAGVWERVRDLVSRSSKEPQRCPEGRRAFLFEMVSPLTRVTAGGPLAITPAPTQQPPVCAWGHLRVGL